MANVFENIQWMTQESLMLLKNNTPFIRGVNKEFENKFTDSPRKGETIKVRKPTMFEGREGETYTEEAYTERFVNFVVQPTSGIDLGFFNKELMFNFERFRERVLAPAMVKLGNMIERKALVQATAAVYNTIGTPGTVPNTLKLYNQARARQFDNAAPQDRQDRLLITANMGVETNAAGQALFHPGSVISKSFLETGYIGRHVGADVMETQNIVVNQVGPLGGTPAVNGASQTGSSLVTNGWTAAAALRLRAGNTIQIAGVFEVNPITFESTGTLRDFVVTADVSSDALGNATIPISPAIITSGPFRNVTGSPANGALISVYGKDAAGQAAIANVTSPQGIRYHRNSFLFGSFDQPIPPNKLAHMETDPDTTIRLRFIQDWDTVKNKMRNRFDVVWAWGNAFPEIACRIAS